MKIKVEQKMDVHQYGQTQRSAECPPLLLMLQPEFTQRWHLLAAWIKFHSV